MNETKKTAAFRQGVITLIVLAVLTGAEYLIAVQSNLWSVLVVIALIKAGLVLQYFMHLPRMFSEDGGH